jgi:hypothetical protein
MTPRSAADRWAFALALAILAMAAGAGAFLFLRPSQACVETCAVLDGEALFQLGNRAWCYDAQLFDTECAQ